MLIDNFADENLLSKLGTRWSAVTDQVMGGVSTASVTHRLLDGRACLFLTGDVRLDNGGGFVQAALDLAVGATLLDASRYAGIRLVVRGNDQRYSVHLRTSDTKRPWQSYRAHFTAGSDWKTVRFPFEALAPHRLTTSLDTSRLRRIGLVGIGRAFQAELAVGEISLYSQE